MSTYQIKQNPELGLTERRIKSLVVYILNNGVYDKHGIRNLNGLHEFRGHSVEVDQESFTNNSELLERVKTRLTTLGIEFKLG